MPWELLKICAWKSAKSLALLSLNSEQEIVTVTRELVTTLKNWDFPKDIIEPTLTSQQWGEWEAMAGGLIGADASHGGPSGLLRLHGVGYPVATAILAFLDPHRFPVMDKWAVDSIFEDGSRSSRWHRKAAYRAYAQFLATTGCRAFSDYKTLRERDIFAMESAMDGIPIPGISKIRIP